MYLTSILILQFAGYHTKNYAHFFVYFPTFLIGELAPLPMVWFRKHNYVVRVWKREDEVKISGKRHGTTHSRKNPTHLCQGKKVTVVYGFSWDMNTGLLGTCP